MIKDSKRLSYLISFALHFLFILVAMFIDFSSAFETEDFVTIGFGTFGNVSSPGSPGKNVKKVENTTKIEKQKKESKKIEKKVELPKSKNNEKDNIIVTTAKKKEKEETPPQKVEPLDTKNKDESTGGESSGLGEGNFGFEIDFGGKGKRKIYSYIIPEYPEGVSKEIDVKLRFSILPDGSVGRIFPLIKADTKLEEAAMNSLRQWRFEPLPTLQNQSEQSAVIVFPYRLR